MADPSDLTSLVEAASRTAAERFDETATAYSVVLQNVLGSSELAALRRLPQVLPNERVVAVAFANTKKRGGRFVVLTQDRLLFVSTSNPGDVIEIDPSEASVAGVKTGKLWGNQATVRAGDVELVLRSLLPTSESQRILRACGMPVPDGTYRALPKGFPRDPGCPPVAGMWEISVYPDRLIDHEGNHLPFNQEVDAVADAAGNIAVTRGRDLAAKGLGTLALGPIGLFFMGNAKERTTDTRELYLLVEGEEWAYTAPFSPDAGALLRQFAQQINVEARRFRAKQAEAAPSSPPPAATQQAGRPTTLATELRELAALRDDGLLTPEEFESQKRKLLDG